MTETQRTTRMPVGEDTRHSIFNAQWLLEKPDAGDPPKHPLNNLDVFICGEEAFAQIVNDLKAAKSSVEIICWGFDPAMELTRSKTVWPRGETWGGLLKDVAEGKYNGGKPVQVRVLSWYGFIGNLSTNNMPGYGRGSDYELRHAVSQGMGAALAPGGRVQPMPEPTTPRDMRETFNARWYRDAFSGALKNIAIRTRDGDSKAVDKSLQSEPGKRSWTETAGMQNLPTDHQKTVLIDYEHEGGCHAVGYVMGLNSVTDYWDTKAHLFHDPRRGEAWEGDTTDGRPGLKPYQDYACRIQGQALVVVSKNFTDAWNRAKCKGQGCGSPLTRTHDLKAPPAGLCAKVQGTGQQAQIVRTLPEDGEKTVARLYRQATSFARRYLYVENQYFQYTEWAQQLKTERQNFVQLWQKAGKGPDELASLHVMVVIPTPEREQMVPRTYDTVKALGQADSMPAQDKQVEDELKAHAKWDAYAKEARAKGEAPSPYAYPGPMSPLAQSASQVGSKGNVAKDLNTLGIRTLVGSLWTFDHEWRSTQAKAMEQAKEWEGSQLSSQRYKEMVNRINQGRYREIYIHSKLMMIDDVMFTLGSANLNTRSMAVDAEINVASDSPQCTGELRRRVWDLHTGGAPGCNPASLEPKVMGDAFGHWQQLMLSNANGRPKGDAPTGFLFPFYDDRTSSIRLG